MATNSRPSSQLSHALRRRPPAPPHPGAKRTGPTSTASHQRNSRPEPAVRGTPAPVKRAGRQGTKRPAPSQASTSPHEAQIQSETALRFGPQQDALATLLRQAIADRDQGIAVQKSTGTGLVNLATRAAPAVAGIEAAGAARLAAPYAGLQQDMGALGANADPIKAAVGRDFALVSANQTADATAAAVELKQRQVDALSGRQAGIGAVQAQYATDKGKIGDQLNSLTGQVGAFGASRLAELLGADTKRHQDVLDQQRQQSFQAGQNQASRDVTTRGQDIASADRAKSRGRRSGTGAKLQSADKHDSAREKLAVGLRTLAELDADRNARHATAPGLVAGAPAVSGQPVFRQVKDPNTGKVTQQRVLKDGVQETTGDLPSVPALGQWATVAADVYYDGHLSRANQVKLQRAGYSIKDLGLPTYAQWKKQGGRRPRSVSSSTSAAAGQAAAGAVRKGF
jgi:hypothetical protein